MTDAVRQRPLQVPRLPALPRHHACSDYRKEVEEDIIYNYMRQQQRKSASAVSPVRIETFYKENKDRFYQEDQVHLRLIQLTRGDGDTDETLQRQGRRHPRPS